MAVRVWDKRYTQKVIKALKAAGYKVNKIGEGFYKAFTDDGTEVFSAMIGSRGYLIRYKEGLFQGS